MKCARFVAAARREFLVEVVYYNNQEPGLGARFAAAVEDATARALTFPLAGALATQNTRRVFSRIFLSLSCIGLMLTASPSLRSRITRGGRAIGNHVLKIVNNCLDGLLVVAHTERNDAIRIISARVAPSPINRCSSPNGA